MNFKRMIVAALVGLVMVVGGGAGVAGAEAAQGAGTSTSTNTNCSYWNGCKPFHYWRTQVSHPVHPATSCTYWNGCRPFPAWRGHTDAHTWWKQHSVQGTWWDRFLPFRWYRHHHTS